MKRFDTSLYFITDSTLYGEEEFLHRVEAALQGGVTILQLREKNRILCIFTVAMVILCAFLGVVLNRNARISEQNQKIEEQNLELQSRLSTAFVESMLFCHILLLPQSQPLLQIHFPSTKLF